MSSLFGKKDKPKKEETPQQTVVADPAKDKRYRGGFSSDNMLAAGYDNGSARTTFLS